MTRVNVEFFGGEYSFGKPTDSGYVPVFADSEEEITAKAKEVFGDDAQVIIYDLNDDGEE